MSERTTIINAFSELASKYQYRTPYLSELFVQLSMKLPLNKSDLLLDLCCGNGQLAIGLAGYVRQVYAVDASDGMLDMAAQTNNISFMAQDVNSPQLIKDLDGLAFDHIVIGRAIHWIEQESLEQLCAARLKDNGSVVIANAGWDPKTEWLGAFNAVRRKYTTSPPTNWNGDRKLTAAGLTREGPVLVKKRARCDIDYLVNQMLSYSGSYAAVSANMEQFRLDLERALGPFMQDDKLNGMLLSSAVIYKKFT